MISKKLLALAIGGALLTACGSDDGNPNQNYTGELQQIGRYSSGLFDAGGAEITAFDASSNKLFVVNSGAASIDVLDLSDPLNPQKLTTLDVRQTQVNGFAAGGANSVAVHNGKLAVAVENDNKQAKGQVYFYHTDTLAFAGAAAVGALPDMVTFTPNGDYVLSANEGEPNDTYDNDPEGSVSIIKVSDMSVRTAGFSEFNQDKQNLIEKGVRIGGPAGTSVAQDLEPEYITISRDNNTAYVALQENNALAVIDIQRAEVQTILPLGYKDHSQPGNGLDANKNDKTAEIELLPVYGMYQPDAIASYMAADGNTYIVSANEGDGRDYDGYSDEIKLQDLPLDEASFSSSQIERLTDADGLGDLAVTNTMGDTDNDGKFEQIYAYGGRSFSIWDSHGQLVFDSGDQFEQHLKQVAGQYFNVSNDNNKIDNRSDNKGPEPEGVTLAKFGNQVFAYIGLERQGGIMVYNISNPRLPQFVQYLNNRDFSISADENNPAAAGDLAPEGLLVISANDSPNGEPLLVVGNEVSGTTTIYQIR